MDKEITTSYELLQEQTPYFENAFDAAPPCTVCNARNTQAL